MEDFDPNTQVWQVDAGGRIYDANLADMQEWIADGSLLRIDRVRKGNLRWIEAGKVPQLVEFFNAKDASEPSRPIVTMTNMEVLGVAELALPSISARTNTARETESIPTPAPVVPTKDGDANSPPSGACSVHPEAEASYACDTCGSTFCRVCPTGYGSTVKICPFCGAMCNSLQPAHAQDRTDRQKVHAVATEGFGFGDFGSALAHPFRLMFSMIIGAIMFAVFSLGSGAGGFGGMFAMTGGTVCLLCANMLTFGVLANTVENFSQGKLDGNFMPSFENFSIWDDVVHPFFLSIGVYISSFGPFIGVVLVAAFMIVGGAQGELNGVRDDAARAVNPELPYAAKVATQGQEVRELVQTSKDQQQKRVEQLESGDIEADQDPGPGVSVTAADPDGSDVEQFNRMIEENRKAELESVMGRTAETKASEKAAFLRQMLGYGILFLLLGGITLLWGLFYFPAACAVAGYTRSFGATLNPTVGLDTIKRLGGTYGLILVMGLILLLVSSVVSGVLNAAFQSFDMPGVGNLPANFLGSMLGFYIAVVFSCFLGYALFKKADQLNLPA